MFSHDASQENSHRIRRVDILDGATTTLAGAAGISAFLNGASDSAQFHNPRGIAIDPSGTFALVGVR